MAVPTDWEGGVGQILEGETKATSAEEQNMKAHHKQCDEVRDGFISERRDEEDCWQEVGGASKASDGEGRGATFQRGLELLSGSRN